MQREGSRGREKERDTTNIGNVGLPSPPETSVCLTKSQPAVSLSRIYLWMQQAGG